jgi:polyisoprenyl-phosphate glycosyltransferase
MRASMREPRLMSVKKPVLYVVSPCYNEAAVIGTFYDALKAVLSSLKDIDHRILLVDDGSSDATLDELNALADRDERVLVYSLSRNFGHQVAISAGIAKSRGDATIVMDSDLQHPPTLIPEMLASWRAGHDVVSAVRRSTDDATLFKRLSSDGFYTVINWLSDTRIEPGAADFCLMSRKARKVLARMPEQHRFVRGLVAWMGFRRAYLPYVAPPRAAGHSKYSLRKMLRLALDAVFAFSVAPIRLATRVGVGIAALGALYLVYTIGRALWLHDTEPGWSSLLSSLLILGGLQLAFTGLIGEYLARVFEQVKGRPLYVFKQTPEERPRRATPAAAKKNARTDAPLELANEQG